LALKSYFDDLCIQLSLLICFGAVKGSPREVIGTSKKKILAFLFPMAKMEGVVIPEHAKSYWHHMFLLEEHWFPITTSF
jgi:condensin-2 complex subunit H2